MSSTAAKGRFQFRILGDRIGSGKRWSPRSYTDVAALVAFSGEVTDPESGIDKVSETSPLMNPVLKGRDIRDAFASDEYGIVIVANKFQIGNYSRSAVLS